MVFHSNLGDTSIICIRIGMLGSTIHYISFFLIVLSFAVDLLPLCDSIANQLLSCDSVADLLLLSDSTANQ